jgi:hypothetical protein
VSGEEIGTGCVCGAEQIGFSIHEGGNRVKSPKRRFR